MVRLFVFGLGYTGSALARTVEAGGGSITGTRREGGEGTIAFDGSAPGAGVAAALAAASHVLVSVPPDAAGDPVLRHHGADLAAARSLRWVGYLSTTGVYGDRGGGWVDEESPRTPSGPRGRRRLAAEDAWLALGRDHGVPVHLFRLAGIYGPGRNALASVRAGTAKRIVKPGQVFSRIHLDDLVAVLRASMARPIPGRVYNVCDDTPAPPDQVIAYACSLLGLPPLPAMPFAEADLSPMARSFYADNKRVANGRIKAELGVRLAYPDYRAGLEALLTTIPPAAPRACE